jgi:hypothetical protein
LRETAIANAAAFISFHGNGIAREFETKTTLPSIHQEAGPAILT